MRYVGLVADIYQALQKFKSEGEAAMIVTVIDVQGAGPVEIGKKMIVSDKDEQVGTVGGCAIEYEARETCKTLIKERRSSMNKYVLSEGTIIKDAKTLPMICGGVVTLFYEYVGYDHFITIFGGGHIGQALTNVLKTMNLHVTVIDEREDVYQTFKNADEKFHMLFTD